METYIIKFQLFTLVLFVALAYCSIQRMITHTDVRWSLFWGIIFSTAAAFAALPKGDGILGNLLFYIPICLFLIYGTLILGSVLWIKKYCNTFYKDDYLRTEKQVREKMKDLLSKDAVIKNVYLWQKGQEYCWRVHATKNKNEQVCTVNMNGRVINGDVGPDRLTAGDTVLKNGIKAILKQGEDGWEIVPTWEG